MPEKRTRKTLAKPAGSKTASFVELDKVEITPDSRLIVTPQVPTFKVKRTLGAADVINTVEASILSDFARRYVGQAMPFPTTTSGVYINFDRVFQTQTYQNLGQYDLMDEIMNDPHVYAVSHTIKLAVASLDWSIEPGMATSAKSKAAAEWCEKVLKRSSNFTQDIYELMDAIFKGFTSSEIMWTKNHKGETVVAELLNIPQRRIQFDVGTKRPKLRTYDSPFYGRPLPERKIIIHRSSSKYEDPFGDALAMKIYWSWLFKRNVEKFWLEFTQNNAGPIPIITIADDADDKLKQEALDVVKGIRSSSYGYKPKSMQLDYVEVKSTEGAANAFEKALRHYDDQITKAVLGQILTTEGSTSGGSGAKAGASISHELTKDRAAYYAHGLEDTLTDTLVRWMCDFNFQLDPDEYPKFQFDLADAPDSLVLTGAILNLEKAGHHVDPQYITETLGFPIIQQKPTEPPPIQKPDPQALPVEEGVMA